MLTLLNLAEATLALNTRWLREGKLIPACRGPPVRAALDRVLWPMALLWEFLSGRKGVKVACDGLSASRCWRILRSAARLFACRHEKREQP